MLEFYKWRENVVEQVRFKPDRKRIREELDAHYEDHVRDLQRIGYDYELAEQRALGAMGDAEEIGRALDRVHKPWLGWLWMASRWGVIVCGVLIAFFCLAGSFDGLMNNLTPVQREGDYEPDGFFFFGEGSPERDDSVRIAVGQGDATVERVGYTLSVPYAAVWKDSRIVETTGEPSYVQYWCTIVVAADDQRFWGTGPVGSMPYMLTAVDDAGRTYDTEWDPDGGNLVPARRYSDMFRSLYYLYIWSPEPPGEWLEISYPYGEPWSIRIPWEEVTA
nr:permease prefix domain 1-containing protein [uncultured Oscillibacter sp.]